MTGAARVTLPFPISIAVQMPQLRGRLLANQSLAELTWFRVGGPAQVLFMPEDEATWPISSGSCRAKFR